MSRLARNPITIPSDVKISVNDNVINFEGKLGKSSSTLPNGIVVDMKDNLLHFSGDRKSTRLLQSHHDLVCRLLLEKKQQKKQNK